MKKLAKRALALMVISIIAVFSTFSAFAAPADDIVATAKECIPSAYESLYLTTFEGALSRIDITQDQANQVVDVLKTTKAKVPTDKGHSLHLYTDAERQAMVDCFKNCCEILKLTYKVEVKNSNEADHKADEVVYVYDSNNQLIATIDGDAVKKTDVSSDVTTQQILLIVAASALVLSAAALFVCKKLNAKENV